MTAWGGVEINTKHGLILICLGCIERMTWEFRGLIRPYPPSDEGDKNKYKKKVISSKLRWEVFKRNGFKCLTCGTQDNLAADHIIPESKGGPTVLENLQTLCHKCNSKKGTKNDYKTERTGLPTNPDPGS